MDEEINDEMNEYYKMNKLEIKIIETGEKRKWI